MKMVIFLTKKYDSGNSVHSLLCGSVDNMTHVFTERIQGMCSECIPSRIVKISGNQKPGMTEAIKRLFKKANRLHKRASRTRSQIDIDKHRAARRKAKSAWKKSQFNFYYEINMKLLDPNTSPKCYWKLIKQEMGRNKTSAIPVIIHEGRPITNDSMKCEVFNRYFVGICESVVTQLARDHLDWERSARVNFANVHLDNISTNELEIYTLTKKFNLNKSSGSDPIPIYILKTCGYEIARPLSILFNKIFESSHFPSTWKRADVIPVFKKDDPKICSNYRPISLLSPTSKLLERVIFNRVYDFCMVNKLLTPKNSGFKKVDSASNQLIHLIHKIYKGLDENKKIAAVFLDVTRAFECVWHEGLIFKLEKTGITRISAQVNPFVFVGQIPESTSAW